MRLKGKLIKWHADKAYGFIAPNGGGSHVFIHKSAFENRQREPQIKDVITFSITKDSDNRYCYLLYTSPSPRDRTRSRMQLPA